MRLRDTAFGRRSVVIWLGEGGETSQVDAVVAATGRSLSGRHIGAAAAGTAFALRGAGTDGARPRAAAASWWWKTTR